MTRSSSRADRKSGLSWGGRLAGLVATAVVLAPLGAAIPASAQSDPMVPVIVQASTGNLGQVRSEVLSHGGRVVLDLSIIDGFSAQLPASAVPVVAALPGVRAITADSAVHLEGAPAAGPGEAYDPAKDPGSLANIAKSVGSDKLDDHPDVGAPIGVALIDSGVTQVPGLAAGNVVNGPDLSLDAGQTNLRFMDQYGHGTHMAGIIAGQDNPPAGKGNKGATSFAGIAPDATVVNVKVGAADGSVDVSQVIAGLDWVVAHHHDPGLNIRVVNLSFGTDSTQDYRIDPLAYAAEAAWHAGIVVVAAAGNEGNQTAVMTDPATDPYVIAVGADGAYDKNGHKLYVTAFSNSGSAGRHPDLVAPGKSIVSLRDPGSLIDVTHPEGLVGDPAARFFRGSGTSQATAVVSGLAALLLQNNPELTPDQIKGLLMANATPLPGVAATTQGAGAVNLKGLDKLDHVPAYTQTWTPADGSGSIEASRGGAHLTLNGQPLTGETTVFGVAFNGHSWSNNAWDAASWAGGTWDGHSWSADTWEGHSWSTTGWTGHSWSADTWDGHSWSGHSWSGHSWSDAAWTGHSWSGDNWS